MFNGKYQYYNNITTQENVEIMLFTSVNQTIKLNCVEPKTKELTQQNSESVFHGKLIYKQTYQAYLKGEVISCRNKEINVYLSLSGDNRFFFQSAFSFKSSDVNIPN